MNTTTETAGETTVQETAAVAQTAWEDVAAESTAAENAKKAETKSTIVHDSIDVPVTEAVLAKIATDNAADDLEKQGLESALEKLKEQVKSTKAKIDVLDEAMSERHEAVRSGVQTITGRFRVVDIFETNTVRYLDPETGEVLCERPMSIGERQAELPFANGTNGSSKLEDDATDEEESADNEELDEDGDAGITEDDGMDAVMEALEGDKSDAESVVDPEAVLGAADSGAAPALSDPPSKPTRKGKKAS